MRKRHLIERLSAAYLNPSTSAGTARWVALGVAAWDCISRGVNAYNAAALLALGGLDVAARWFSSRGEGGPGSGLPQEVAPCPR